MPVRVILLTKNAEQAEEAAEAVFARFAQLNRIMSDYDSDSEIRRACRTAGTEDSFVLSDDLWKLLQQCRIFTQKTKGTFDPTVGPVISLWRRSRRLRELPPPKYLDRAVALVGSDLWKLNSCDQSVEFRVDRMRLDLGGIAKGYAIDEACRLLQRKGFDRFLVDAGGDLRVGRRPPGEPGWVIGIAPLTQDGPPQGYLVLENSAVASSGDTWQFVEIDGVRYSHIVDPRTGMALTDRLLATVVAPDATTADVLASAVSVLGPEEGLALIENWNDQCSGSRPLAVTISRKIDQKWNHYFSSSWKKLRQLTAEEIASRKREGRHLLPGRRR
jgi:thiamine biosynthesis lipoprotein